MKNIVYGVFFVVIIFFCASTAWAQKVYKPSNSNDNIIGIVQAIVEVDYFNTTPSSLESRVANAAYTALLAEAGKNFRGNIDIRDITWSNGKKLKGFMQEYSTTGKVILLGGSGGSAAKGIEGALERAINDVSKDFNNNARIAIVQISAPDRSTRDYMIGELEYILQKQGYYMVDRAQLDKIFEEQRFGATSDVDDNTAARMGKISGASIVITGKVDGEGNLRRLRLRALNTETARVVGVASERL